MTPDHQPDLVEIIDARDNLSRQIDEEFDGLPVQPKIRRWYDWNRRCYRTSRLLDCGGKRRQAPAPEIGPDKPPYLRATHRDRIINYINTHGPVTKLELTTAFGLSRNAFNHALYESGLFECFYPDGQTYGAKLWRVK